MNITIINADGKDPRWVLECNSNEASSINAALLTYMGYESALETTTIRNVAMLQKLKATIQTKGKGYMKTESVCLGIDMLIAAAQHSKNQKNTKK